jgi:hypothetical protein
MSPQEFFENVLPHGTRYSLRLVKKIPLKEALVYNRMYTSAADMADAVEEFNNNGWDVYYATAGFGAAKEADADNAVAKREFYVDVDCGPKKPHADKAAGLVALREFCKTVGLPKPTLIDSGNGIHAHWYLQDPAPIHEWKATADALKARCVKEGFEVDGACTADIVRVLRIPGTLNRKNDTPVTLLTPVKYYAFETIRDAVGVDAGDMFAQARALSGGVSHETKKLYIDPNRISKFETIWIKSNNGEGCAQIAEAAKNQESTPEPVWRAVLSIAQHCEDRDWAIHDVSKNHPNYSPEETERKAALTKGPYTCETFQGLDNAKLCAGCPHLGKITSPIQLGSEIKVSPPEPVQVEVNENVIEIPPYPPPFYRGGTGGVYQEVNLESGGSRRIRIYDHDIYIYKRMRDTAGGGDTLWARHHLPHGDIREFSLLQSEIAASDKFKEAVNREGVIAFEPRQLIALQQMFGLMIRDLQFKEKADNMRTRFGWTQDNTFVIGNREYTKRGVVYTPVAKPVEHYVSWFTPKGTLEKWTEIAQQYNHPEMDYHAAGLLAGFGSVLMNLSPENGGIINFYSKRSGTGKTTILRMALSVFGDPVSLMKDAQDKTLTKVHRLGLMNGIVGTLDEMTNADPHELSDLVYNNTQGRGRDRMEAGRNAERVNNIRWKQISVWSSNSTVEDRLLMIKSDPAGELARILEIHLRTPVPSDVLEKQKLFNALLDNYGHAADVFLRYVIPNLDQVKTVWENTRDAIYSKNNWTQTERFKLNNVVCIITAGLIVNSLGLVKFNVSRIMDKLLKCVKQATYEQELSATSAIGTVATYINKNIRNVLIVNRKPAAVGINDRPILEPMGELLIRYEPDSDVLYISKKEFTKWCAQTFINVKELYGSYKQETGGEMTLIKKRMGAGWRADFGAVDAIQFNEAKKYLNLDVEDFPNQAASAG